MRRALAWIAVGAALTGATAPPPTITDLTPIVLHPGVNHVPGFLADGRAATIVEAWRGNGNAHGYHVWMVLGGPSEGNPVGVVGVAGSEHFPVFATIGDEPFDGERVLGAVRFAKGRIDGKPATLLVKASLDESPSGVLADHSTATVTWYRLDHASDEMDMIGRTVDEFLPVATVHTTRRYCNAELAMRDIAHIALPRGFEGANRIDGCFHDRR